MENGASESLSQDLIAPTFAKPRFTPRESLNSSAFSNIFGATSSADHINRVILFPLSRQKQ
jgi:hypothetical protein